MSRKSPQIILENHTYSQIKFLSNIYDILDRGYLALLVAKDSCHADRLISKVNMCGEERIFQKYLRSDGEFSEYFLADFNSEDVDVFQIAEIKDKKHLEDLILARKVMNELVGDTQLCWSLENGSLPTRFLFEAYGVFRI